jgi:flagellar hook-associated protein 2
MSAISKRSVTLMQNRQATLNKKSQAYGTVLSKLNELKTKLEELRDPASFGGRDASSSDSDVLTVTGSNTAAVGSYSVKVLQMAQAERLGSQGVTSQDTVIGSSGGKFTVQVGTGAARSYNLTGSTTLTDLRNMINSDTQSGVSATIVNDGSATNSYRLVLSSKATGAANTIQITSTGTTLDFANKTIEAPVAATGNQFNGTVSSSGTYTGTGTKNLVLKVVQAGDLSGGDTAAQLAVSLDGGMTFDTTNLIKANTSGAIDIPGAGGVQMSFTAGTQNLAAGDSFSIDVLDPVINKASDAIMTVDGIRISRSSNTFSDVIEGVTLTAKSVSASAITATVSNQEGSVNAKVVEFQTAVNDFFSTIKGVSTYDSDTKVAQPLFGDSSVRTLLNTVKSMVIEEVPGFTGKYNSLASLGMKLNSTGTLDFNQSTLNTALKEDFEGVLSLFTQMGKSTNSLIQFNDATDSTEAKEYLVNITAVATKGTLDGAALTGTLAAAETLTFTSSGDTFSTTLAADSSLQQVVDQLNSKFSSEGAKITASINNGALRLETSEYGSKYSFNVTSDRAASAANQLGIGTTQQTRTGTDVEGTIDGSAAVGAGQILTAMSSSKGNGLSLKITSTAPTAGTISFSRGLADRILDQIKSYTESDGVLSKTQTSISDTVKGINDHITAMNTRIEAAAARMRKQFTAMEKQLAAYQTMSSQLTQGLAQLQSSSSSSS